MSFILHELKESLKFLFPNEEARLDRKKVKLEKQKRILGKKIELNKLLNNLEAEVAMKEGKLLASGN